MVRPCAFISNDPKKRTQNLLDIPSSYVWDRTTWAWGSIRVGRTSCIAFGMTDATTARWSLRDDGTTWNRESAGPSEKSSPSNRERTCRRHRKRCPKPRARVLISRRSFGACKQ
eukprot:scaffold1347_cov350-Pavlova_lutheri.AAC.37